MHHPYAAASLADAAAFNRSEVAERIRRSFDAMVARSPIATHLVRTNSTYLVLFFKHCQSG